MPQLSMSFNHIFYLNENLGRVRLVDTGVCVNGDHVNKHRGKQASGDVLFPSKINYRPRAIAFCFLPFQLSIVLAWYSYI